jgi:phage gp29-like protein
MSLYDYKGDPIAVQRKPRPGRAGILPLWGRQGLSTVSFATPEQIKAAWLAAKRGEIQTLMQIGNELENDLQILGLVRTRRLAVAQIPWRIEAADQEDKKTQAIADNVQAMLKRVNLRRAIRHLQDAVIKPLAVVEIVWSNQGEKTDVAALVPRLGTELTFDYRESGTQVRLITETAKPRGEPIEPLKFIVRFSEEKGATLPGEGGTLKGLAGRWLIKTHLLINWSIFAERDGQPFRVGKYDAGAQDEDIATLKRAVEEIGVDAGAVITKDMEIQIVEGAKNSGRDVFSIFLEQLHKEMAIGILGQVLTSAGSDQGAGSLALGEVHNEVRHDLLEADAIAISDCLNEQLIKPYVYFNYGEQKIYPQLLLETDPGEDLSKQLERVDKLARLNLPIAKTWLYRTFRIPEPQAEEQTLEVPLGMPGLGFGGAGTTLAEAFRRRLIR